MRARHVVCSSVLSLLVEGTAFAQTAEPAPAGKSVEEVEAIKKQSAEWLTTCLSDWDAATHISRMNGVRRTPAVGGTCHNRRCVRIRPGRLGWREVHCTDEAG